MSESCDFKESTAPTTDAHSAKCVANRRNSALPASLSASPMDRKPLLWWLSARSDTRGVLPTPFSISRVMRHVSNITGWEFS